VERLAGRRTLLQRLGEFELTVNASSFAQPNAEAAGALYRTLTAWAGRGRHAWELYAGGGAIAFHLAESFDVVTAVEVDRGAITRGEADAARLGLGNVRFVRADARSAPLPADADVLIVDPPRAGLSAELRAAVAASGIPRMLYISCDVATWARDVVDLAVKGYTLTRMEPFDFYPQTHHIEILSELTLSPSRDHDASASA
jgi:tRNA/tmRNA/rRNA uracil-C5-methylase (TrmA/RlmC/RlmD family)